MLVGAVVDVALARGLLEASELDPLVGRGSRSHITVRVPRGSALQKPSFEHLDSAVAGQFGPRMAESGILSWILPELGNSKYRQNRLFCTTTREPATDTIFKNIVYMNAEHPRSPPEA